MAAPTARSTLLYSYCPQWRGDGLGTVDCRAETEHCRTVDSLVEAVFPAASVLYSTAGTSRLEILRAWWITSNQQRRWAGTHTTITWTS
jgi:hypothetical protein